MVFLSTDLSGFSVKKGLNMVDMIFATGIFLFLVLAKVGRERLVYFIVSYHVVLNFYFIK